ncbi:Ig-like domain-containing protein [Halpernia frigidisoli]|uniref:Gliding motility-associated C-terminal domain-containing protein n=1 Tax=Halpernia frigidisoli TaxID=1125876 RepID=A0A1I3GE35_9FLAO|nr:gliding motility-associated C-terminal domain-containing protein [Halpernia frigidisoli]SFI21750.1 gliding motility-associated C-terminal domain-containing protein [Halpernia frigidisoli]
MENIKDFGRNIKLIILLIFLNLFSPAQTCGGTFGNPIFTETFGSVNTPNQTVSPPLASPASTTYPYTATFPVVDGSYTIANQSRWDPYVWLDSFDHTVDTPGTYGNMLIVNASASAGEFYRRRVSNLCPNQVYKFSTWILNIDKPGINNIKPNVTVEIRSTTNALLGTISTGDIAQDATWKEFSVDFKSDVSSTDVQVILINNSPGGNGNDIAIDDISFRPCGPSTSTSANVSNIFTTGVCDNSQDVQLTANLSTNTFLNVNYIWQKSTDNGITWINQTLPTSNPNLNILGGTYQNGDQFRFIVGEALNILSTNCQVISTPISLKINGYPTAPTVTSPINYCQNSVATALTAIGTDLLWYTSATGGTGSSTAPIPDTSILGTTSYFVSQTTTGCESPRSEIKVIINPIPTVPTVTSPINYCQNSIAIALNVNGTNLLWYTSATGGTANTTAPIPDTSILGTISYFVSQNNGNCESARAEIKVNILANPNPPTVTPQINYCQNLVATSLTATGNNLLWYNSDTGGTGSTNAPIPNTSAVGTTSYFVSQNDGNCESSRSEIKVIINPIPTAPTVTSQINYCQNSIAISLTATGTNLLWYTSVTGGSGSTTAPIPDTSVLGTISYFVTQTIVGCESTRAEIKVNILANPNAPTVTSPVNYCQNSVAIALTANGTNLLWYTSATGGTGSATAPIPNTSTVGATSYFVSQNNGNCESTRAEIKVNISQEPHSATLVDATICNGETIVLDAGSGFSSYEWNTTPPIFTQTLQVSKIGTYSVILTNANNCSATQSVKVTAGVTPTIVNIISTEKSIEIIASGGNPPYSYSIDNQQSFQNNNVFTNLMPGIYTVFVKSQLNSCSISQETAVIFIPNVITPNNDSLNDIFKINNIQFFPNAKISIFDRYGKAVFISKDKDSLSWDGRYLGRILATGTYYYILDLGNNYQKTGWILLKNKN